VGVFQVGGLGVVWVLVMSNCVPCY